MTTNPKTPYISCLDLFKIYKAQDLEVVALRGLDLEVMSGEIIAIVGASGSGKSTFLNILAGYDKPSAGEIRVGERNLLHINTKEAEDYRLRNVGFVWQQTARNLVPYLTALENVELPMILAGFKAKYGRSLWSHHAQGAPRTRCPIMCGSCRFTSGRTCL